MFRLNQDFKPWIPVKADQLQEIIAGAKAARSPELKKQDKGGNSGILRYGFFSQRERLRKCMS